MYNIEVQDIIIIEGGGGSEIRKIIFSLAILQFLCNSLK
jgi:hypothetical protein